MIAGNKLDLAREPARTAPRSGLDFPICHLLSSSKPGTPIRNPSPVVGIVTMAGKPSAAKKPRSTKVEELEVVSLSEQSEASSDGGAESGSSSDSDALDSDAPRKKRKVSVQVEVDPEDDEPYQASVISSIQAPSRIGRKTAPSTLPVSAATSVPVDPHTTFDALKLRPWLVQSLSNMAIKRPTGIQKSCIPEILKGRDCIGGSRTGSGKTVAFAAPILQKLAEDPSAIFAVILTATR